MDFITNNLGLLAGGTSAGIVLWLLKRIPNEEPYFVDLLNNTVKAAVDGFIDGLRSDK